MDVQHITFTKKRSYGAEIEIIDNGLSKGSIRDIIASIDKTRQVRVSGWEYSVANSFWHVKSDSSCGLEIASYVAKGYRDLLIFGKVAEMLQAGGAKVSDKCGFHVHVDVRDFSTNQMATLVANWLRIENIIANMLPEHRVNNKYCKMLSKYYVSPDNLPKTPSSFWECVRPYCYGDNERRVALNICNFAKTVAQYYHPKCTVELRLPEGTLEHSDVKNWIRLFVRFVDYNKTRPFPKSIDKVGLPEALELLGLNSPEFILSNGLRDAKEWFLRRVLKYTRQKRLCKQAIDILNCMWFPLKAFELSSNGEEYLEKEIAA